MTRIAKLNDRLISRQPISFAELQTLLEAYGFRLRRVTGSHHTYVHPSISEIQVIQPDGKDAKDYQVRQFRDKIERHALSLEDTG